MQQPAARASQAAFVFIFITVLLDMVSFGMIIPVFPQLILRLQGGDMAGAAAIFGIFGTAFAVMQFFFSPVLGSLSDRFAAPRCRRAACV